MHYYFLAARAEAYKEDGNEEFKKKQYRIAIDNYTEGIKCLCPDRDLNAVLYTNRAAAQYHLGRKSFALEENDYQGFHCLLLCQYCTIRTVMREERFWGIPTRSNTTN